MGRSKVVELGGVRYNTDWLRSVTEEKAVRYLKPHDSQQVRNAWKQANGKTVRNYSKKTVKKTVRKKKED